MKIYCPKCHTCYSIETGLIPIGGKKFRCSNCGEVWLCTHKDLQAADDDTADFQMTPNDISINIPTDTKEEEETSVNSDNDSNNDSEHITTVTEDSENKVSEDDLQQIFARLQTETQKINTEVDAQSTIKKSLPKIKKLLGWDNRFTIFIELIIFFLIIGLSIFGNRYEIVRKFPQTEQFFHTLGIQARVIGEGLDFQNITRKYEDSEHTNILSINGFIYNTTNNELNIPTILVRIMNSETDSLQEIKTNIDAKTITSHNKIPFHLTLEISPQEAKYILLTFTE